MCKENIFENAMNVYRTENYIVKQNLTLHYDEINGCDIISSDTYFARTKARDKEFDAEFKNKKYKNGKRIPATMFSRKYEK